MEDMLNEHVAKCGDTAAKESIQDDLVDKEDKYLDQMECFKSY